MEQELIERGEGMGVGPAILVLNPVPKSWQTVQGIMHRDHQVALFSFVFFT